MTEIFTSNWSKSTETRAGISPSGDSYFQFLFRSEQYIKKISPPAGFDYHMSITEGEGKFQVLISNSIRDSVNMGGWKLTVTGLEGVRFRWGITCPCLQVGGRCGTISLGQANHSLLPPTLDPTPRPPIPGFYTLFISLFYIFLYKLLAIVSFVF